MVHRFASVLLSELFTPSMNCLTVRGVSQDQPSVIMKDNQGAICIAKNPIALSRTKHIGIHYHYIREALCDKIIELEYCLTKQLRVVVSCVTEFI